MQLLRKLIWFFEAGELGQTLGMMNPSSEAAMSSRLVLRSFSEAWCMISERERVWDRLVGTYQKRENKKAYIRDGRERVKKNKKTEEKGF